MVEWPDQMVMWGRAEEGVVHDDTTPAPNSRRQPGERHDRVLIALEPGPLGARTPDGPRVQITRSVLLADLSYTQQGVSSETMPQAVGGLATFAGRFVDFAVPPRIFKYPERLASALDTPERPGLVGFSHYVWNANLASHFAKAIKARWPDTVTVFGGPHLPIDDDDKRAFLLRHPEMDFYVEKEGELAFVALLRSLEGCGWQPAEVAGPIPGVHMARGDHALLAGPPQRLTDLSAIPSPYVCGLMDEFFDGRLIPTLTTNRGCPFTCTFCLEGSRYYNKVYRSNAERVHAELHYMGQMMRDVLRKGGRNELLVTDSNFGMFTEDRHTCETIAECQDLYGWPQRVNVTTGKNHRQRVLSSIRLTGGAIQLSGAVQSLDEDVLEKVRRRNISASDLLALALDATEEGTETYSDVVLGLPGDNRERHAETLRQLVDAGFGRINTFQLMMLPGSELGRRSERERFGLRSSFRLMPRCYGRVDILGRPVASAEVDEVCVASSSMSYEDYLRCRQLDLALFALYNDSPTEAVLCFVRRRGISAFDWLLSAQALLCTTATALFEDFVEETRVGSWASADELLAFVGDPANWDKVERHATNQLYTYRVRAINECWDELVDASRRAAAGLVSESDHGLVSDLATFDHARLAGVFRRERETRVTATLRHDVEAYLRGRGTDDIDAYRFDAPRRVVFSLSADQEQLIDRYLDLFGDDAPAVGRFLSRFTLSDVRRRPVAAEVLTGR